MFYNDLKKLFRLIKGTDKKQTEDVTNPLKLEEATALLKFAAEQGIDHSEDIIIGLFESVRKLRGIDKNTPSPSNNPDEDRLTLEKDVIERFIFILP